MNFKGPFNEQDLPLPSTVTELVASNGVKVYVVGTIHISERSQMDVVRTIRKVQPRLVVLEHCLIRQIGIPFAEQKLVRSQQRRPLPGGEFLVAEREANKIPNCRVILGDRPEDITTARASATLGIGEKMKRIIKYYLFPKVKQSGEDLRKEAERQMKEDARGELQKKFMKNSPGVFHVILTERDTILAHSLWCAATSPMLNPKPMGPVVGVVGMGHVAGIVEKWGKTTDEEVLKLMALPEPSGPIAAIQSARNAMRGWFQPAQRISQRPPRQLQFTKVVFDHHGCRPTMFSLDPRHALLRQRLSRQPPTINVAKGPSSSPQRLPLRQQQRTLSSLALSAFHAKRLFKI